MRIEFALRPNLHLAGAKLADFGLVKLGSVYKLDDRHLPIFLSTLARLASGYLPVSGQILSLPKICYVILHIVVESQETLNTLLKRSGAQGGSSPLLALYAGIPGLGSRIVTIRLLVNPAGCRVDKADGVPKGEKRQLSPLVDRVVSNPVVDIRLISPGPLRFARLRKACNTKGSPQEALVKRHTAPLEMVCSFPFYTPDS